MSNKEAKRISLLIGALVLAWAITPRALAQTTGTLYDRYGTPTKNQSATPSAPSVKRIQKIAKSKKLAKKKLTPAQAARLRKNKNLRAQTRRSVKPMARTAVVAPRYKPVASNLNGEINEQLNSLQSDLSPMSDAQIRARQRARQLQKLAAAGALLAPSDDSISATASPLSRSTLPMPKLSEGDKETEFGGSVSFLVGHDDNIDPEKTGVVGTFYAIDPTLTFKHRDWSGSIGATIRDYAEQETSDTEEQTEAKASVAYAPQITQMIKSTTTVDGVYHDERWPNYLNGYDIDNLDHGMPRRYTDAKLTEALDFNFGSGFTSQVGGYAEHQEASDLYSDWAPDEEGQLMYKPSFNQYSAFGRVGYQVNDLLEFALRPSVTQRAYTAREARQPDGSPGGLLISAPLYQTVDAQLAFDTNFKFGDSLITPTMMVGQVTDPVYGAMDSEYYGGGLVGKIVLIKDIKLTLSPSVVYKFTQYDNWVYETENPGEKRQDSDLTAGVGGSVNVSKNVALLLNYQKIRALSTYTDTAESFNEEIFSTGVMFSF